MSSEKEFMVHLKEITSLNIFVSLLQSDLDVYEQNNSVSDVKGGTINVTDDDVMVKSNLPDFVRLILNILKNYNFEENNIGADTINIKELKELKEGMSKNKSKLNMNMISPTQKKLMKDIFSAFIRFMHHFNTEKQIIEEIFNFFTLSSLHKEIFEEFISNYNPEKCK